MFSISIKNQTILLGLLLITIHAVLLKPMVLDGLIPQGVDVVASKGQSKQISEFAKETGEKALWNPNMFSGQPIYFRFNPQTPSIDTMVNVFQRFFGTAFIWYLVGSFGFFFLMRYMGISPIVSFAGALAFTLLPHYQSLWIEGHATKFRAVMAIPWVVYAARYFFDTRSLLGAAFFAVAFGNQIRTQHYQIIFYTAILIFAIGVTPLIKDLLKCEWNRFLKSTGFLFGSIFLALMLAAQPLFLAGEYLPYSARGAHTADLSKKSEEVEKKKGLDFSSATQWSTHPSALVAWAIPRFEGGMSSETYKGDDYKQLKGRVIPGYWGNMPFTQSYEYFGPVILILALFGLIWYRHRSMIVGMSVCALFFILLSFGRHLDGFYRIFFNYLPYFQNFRAPMMSITLTGFIVCFLATLGLQSVYEKVSMDHRKSIFTVAGLCAFLGLFVWLGDFQFSYLKLGEQYNADVEAMIVSIRREFLLNDLYRYIGIAGISIGSIFAVMMTKISRLGIVIMLTVIMSLDLISVQMRKPAQFVNLNKLERKHFRKTDTDKFLLNQHGTFRVLPLGKMFGDNRWSYFHQNAGGYSPIKMNRMDEIIKNSLFSNSASRAGLNLNVLQILNVKYVISGAPVKHAQLTPVFQDSRTGWQTFYFEQALPRAYFVGNSELIPKSDDRLRRLNSSEFQPVQSAILETELKSEITKPASASVNFASFSPNQIAWDISTDSQSLLVISETPYKPGWKASIDGEEVDIYPANHVNMAIVVPEGNHKVEFIFHPDSYYFYSRIENLAALILYGIILGLLYRRRNDFFPQKKITD